MPRSSEPSAFSTLRSWDGSQSRAFEELGYQLLKEEAPPGSPAIRTGNPDGGVEWYCELPDGSQYGWQAKHVDGIDALLTAMTGSVRRVAVERPNLIRLTFVISWNLATGTQGRERKSQLDKYNDKVETWKATIAGADRIEFLLIQESDLLDRLAQPRHRGRQWFWWNQPTFDGEWFALLYDRQNHVAGEKYRPDLQVDLPIAQDLRGLGFAETFVDDFHGLSTRVVRAGGKARLSTTRNRTLGPMYKKIQHAQAELLAMLGNSHFDPTHSDELDDLENHADKCSEAIRDAVLAEGRLRHDWEQLTEAARRRRKKPPEEASGYRVREFWDATGALLSFLQSDPVRALRQRVYLLTGAAGSGKTHLLLDGMRVALDESRPAVVLFGIQFGGGDLWTSVCDQLGLAPQGADVLLGALDSAAEASSLSGARCVIMIDAVNETATPGFWDAHLAAMRAAIQRWPHLALVISCRDTYSALLDSIGDDKGVMRRSHPGFAGREVEATQKYFDHYGLEAPRIPLLTPEFTLPLFLRLYCEGLRDEGVTAVGHEGRVRIFERFLKVKLQRVSRRLRPGASTDYEVADARRFAREVLDVLLAELAATGSESLTLTRAEEIVGEAASADRAEAVRILGAFQSEGVVTQEPIYDAEFNRENGLRIAFQAFADFLILRRRLSTSSNPLTDDALRQWLLADASFGVLEAATVVFPESYSLELVDYLELQRPVERSQYVGAFGSDERVQAFRIERLYIAAIETLPYREASSISDRTIELLNDAMPLLHNSVDLFNILALIAPQPENRLNGDAFHRYLNQFKMPVRDSYFGMAVLDEIWDESSPLTRLARWAAGGPYRDYDPEVVRLASVPLLWLTSTPNRFMRDWVTKALVQLLHGHLTVVATLLKAFWVVDDPYIVQRMLVVAYGSLLRGGTADPDGAKEVVTTVRRLVFKRPMERPDELMLDAAKGIVGWGLRNGLVTKAAAKSAQRPYGFKIPGNPRSEARLEKLYGYKEGVPDEKSYSTVFGSFFGLGDFGRYVVESGIHHFSRYRHGQAMPDREYRKPRIIKSKLKAFERSLDPAQAAALADLLESPDATERVSRWNRGESEPVLESITREQWELLEAAKSYPKPPPDAGYPGDRAKRWVFSRTLSLGWTPERFGHADRMIGYRDRGRSEHKVERWGKKYQWMAYHEFLARVADNYQPSHLYDDQGPYEGLHQITAAREIDPTLPPVDYRAFVERSDGVSGPTWLPSPIELRRWPFGVDLGQYYGSISDLIADETTEPKLDKDLKVVDEAGTEWVVLDGFFNTTDPGTDERWRGLNQLVAVDSWFVHASPAPSITDAFPLVRRADRHELVDTHGHTDCCYAGEVGVVDHTCYNRHAEWRSYDDEIAGQVWDYAFTTESYCWEGGILDCSIEESVSATMPSTFLRQRASLTLSVDGPSWVDPSGSVAFTYLGGKGFDSNHVFLVRSDWLSNFLAEHDLELLSSAWFERRFLDAEHTRRWPHLDVYIAARVDATLTIHPASSADRRCD